MRLLVKIASRERPGYLTDVLRACDRLLSHAPDQVRILLSLDSDDEKMLAYEPPAIANVPITMCYSSSESKVHAINRDIEGFLWPWDVVVVLADDMVPVLQDFDRVILEKMAEHFPTLDGSLWLEDSRRTSKRICTIPVMGRRLWERRGRQVYNRAFKAYWCDDEETHRGIMIEGSMVHLPINLARHDHSMFGEREPDNLFKRNKRMKGDDAHTYAHRAKHGYEL